ncbi:heme-binding protein [Candidatus Bandiella numerosa]|uniref:SOUL family heme-binding protein n=1 Tax=Candidatus Bandiella numerosa TaxID=2570586 RepID=UPI00249F8603|nr:heme-binding protein [Candidatus Bandiella numerosa]WHA04640.1 heme-binding protein [Candidatus Bandiella numerosa]
MNKKYILIASVVLVIILGCILVGPIMSNVEKPKYHVISSQENIEIRKYNPMIIALVEVQGERKEAIRGGFKILADYIFGNNKSKEDIPMTAPVRQQKFQENWQISFIMPSEYNMETLPQPNNKNISLKELPSKKYIVINFSGIISDQNIALNEEKLKKYIFENEIQSLSTPIYAFYNPPWTLSFMRRNEIMMEIN